MSTALEAASLIMIPTSYSDGLLASVKPNDGAGDFTFSRGSNLSATRVNADGNIEKGYENLLLHSNDFSQSVWSKYVTSVTSGQTGYDGSSDAWLLDKNAPDGRITQDVNFSGVTTFSIYAKANTNSWIRLLFNPSSVFVYFDLANGVVGSSYGTSLIDTKIESVGNGWYRCLVVLSGSFSSCRVYSAEANTTSATTGSIYIQDAMLNQGLVAYPYVQTTTASVASGILEDMPRIDFSGGNQSLLLEPSRTNLASHSEYLEAMVPDNCNITSNSILSTEGVLNASKFEGLGNALYIRARQVVSLPAAGNYCFSIYVKAGTSTNMTIVVANYTATNTSADFVLTGDGSTTSNDATIEPVGNGWYRCCVYPIMDGIDLNGNFYVYVANETGGLFYPSASDTLGKSLYFYGMQVEQGSYPTSYIPTYGVSQTRLQDDAYITSASSIINSEEGVLFCEVEALNEVLESFFEFKISNGLNQVRIQLPPNSNIQGAVFDGGYQALINHSATRKQNNKIAFKYKVNDFALFINGVKVGSDTSGTTFSANFLNRIDIGNEAKVKQALLFPTVLSDDECITLTTI